MIKLNNILSGIKILSFKGDENIPVKGIALDSRKVKEGFLFAAITGSQADGHQFITAAIEKGARHILLEKLPEILHPDVNYILTDNTASALALSARNFYKNPSQKLELTGITGTNGKTTIATLLYNVFKKAGYKAGLISTIRIISGDKIINATQTTPDVITINELLNEMTESGCSHCFAEVSSHSVVQHRITGLTFTAGVFTNITRDHLDYHGSFKNYIEAKKGFFDILGKGSFAVINADDKHAKYLVQNTGAAVSTYALKNPAIFRAKIIESDISGLHLKLDGNDFYTDKAGRFNAYNLLAAYSTCVLLGMDKDLALEILSSPIPVDGRFEIIKNENSSFTGIVDYAHTPDALENVLNTIADCRKKGSRIITVFGCGGNRDKGKRPMMGRISATMSDFTIITSDNPRFEEPDEIIREILAGIDKKLMKNVLAISDREQAIKTACSLAKQGDIVLVAGKGHETYQEIKGFKNDFDDRKILNKYLSENY